MSEKFTDVIDQAQQTTEMLTNLSEQAVRHRAQPKQFKDPDGVWPTEDCEGCGEPIGHARLEATGAVTCINCETIKEQLNKRYHR